MITFGDASSSQIIAKGTMRINNSFILKDVALVSKLRYNLISVSHLTNDDFEVSFKRNACKILDSSGSLVCGISRFRRIFCADFVESSVDSLRCFVSSESRDISFWHKILGHIGFDHLTRVSGHDLICGLLKLKMVKELVCACRHSKMVATSHPSVTVTMTDAPGQLLHMETIDLAKVQSASGKWYVFVVVDDFSRIFWCFS